MNTNDQNERPGNVNVNRDSADMKHREIQVDPIVSRRRDGETELELPRKVITNHKHRTDYSLVYKILGIVGAVVVVLILFFSVLLPRAIGGSEEETGNSSLANNETEKSNNNDKESTLKDDELAETTEYNETNSDDSVLNNEDSSDGTKSAEDETGDDLTSEVDKVSENLENNEEPEVDNQSNGNVGAVGTDGYTIPTSNSVLLSTKDLEGLTQSQLELARNEIYARHGRIFTRSDLQKYFEGKSWYKGTVKAENFSNTLLSKIEVANITSITKYEQSKGYR